MTSLNKEPKPELVRLRVRRVVGNTTYMTIEGDIVDYIAIPNEWRTYIAWLEAQFVPKKMTEFTNWRGEHTYLPFDYDSLQKMFEGTGLSHE